MRPTLEIVLNALFLLVLVSGCAAAAEPKVRGEQDWVFEEGTTIGEDWDKSEERWRKEISDLRWSDDEALTTEEVGAVGKSDDEAPAPKTGWGRFKAGASTFGKASFAALTVFVTLGMMVAPYLLL